MSVEEVKNWGNEDFTSHPALLLPSRQNSSH
jgi:hypothetical protein